MARVVERVRHHDEPAAEHLRHQHARRVAGLVLGVAGEAVRDHEPVVELPLRLRPAARLAGLEERRDRVLVAVDVAGLQPHDERHRHALGGRRRVDLVGRRRVLRVVRLERAAVAVRVRPGQRGAVPRARPSAGRGTCRTARWSHLASLAPAWQVHGWICGPAKTGPPIGWFVTYSRAAPPPRMRAVSGTRPTRRPRTRPSRRRGPVRRSARVTLRCPAVSRRREARTPRGSLTRTSASPPDTRSARFDRTLIRGAGTRASAAIGDSKAPAQAASASPVVRRPPTSAGSTRRGQPGAPVSLPSAAHPW